MRSHIMCTGCRSILLYPRGASNVCCAVCSTITPVIPVLPPGMEMSQLYCGGCRTLLMHARGATSVRCSCCNTINLVPDSNQMNHIRCGNCRTTLMYPYGAPSVKCAVCHYITNVDITNGRPPTPVRTPNETTSSEMSRPRFESQTVVVENPMSVDSSGKLVSRLIYTNQGVAILALAANVVHKLWKWQKNDRNTSGKATASLQPQLWQPSSGILMTNEIGDTNPEDAVSCFALSKNDSYVMSASGGKISLFNMMTFNLTRKEYYWPSPQVTMELKF